MQCMDDRLTPHFLQNSEFDSNIRHMPPLNEEQDFIPYVGNGYIGVEVAHDASLNIKSKRSMQLPTLFHPIVSVRQPESAGLGTREATVVEYLQGIVYRWVWSLKEIMVLYNIFIFRFQCFNNYFVSSSYYAHRTNPSILMQEIKITNTRNSAEEVELVLPRVYFKNPTIRPIQLG